MFSIKPDDLLRYVEGEIEDAEELARLEAALESDPALAAECDDLEASLDPAPDVVAYVRGMVQALDTSVWARFQFSAEKAASGEPEHARLELPGGQTASVTLRTTTERVHFAISPPAHGWRAASIALFHPRVTGAGPMEVSGGSEETVSPAPRSAHGRGKGKRARAAEATLESLGAHTDMAWDMAAEHEDRGWISDPATDAHGGRAWLEDSVDGLMLVVNLPESSVPVHQARYRLRWRDPRRDATREKPGTVFLESASEGRRIGQVPLELRTEDVRNSPTWSLRVEPVGGEQPLHLDTSQLRAVVGDGFQTLILVPTSGKSDGQRVEFEAPFEDDQQRAIWADRDALRWVRFERA
jgi:hypothetical protein